jgi:hypothetical protein
MAHGKGDTYKTSGLRNIIDFKYGTNEAANQLEPHLQKKAVYIPVMT